MKAVYRVVSALLAALIFPALYFLNLIHYIIELKITEGYLNDNVTLQQLYNMFSDGLKSADRKPMGAHLAAALQPLKASAILTVVFIVLMLLMALAVIVCSAFTNARKVNLCLAGAGLAATIGAMAAFNHMTALVIGGTVPLGSILNAAMADSSSFLAALGSMFGAGNASSLIGDLVLLRLGSAFTATVILFGFIIMWTIAFLVIDLDPNGGDNAKVKKLNKAKK